MKEAKKVRGGEKKIKKEESSTGPDRRVPARECLVGQPKLCVFFQWQGCDSQLSEL